MRFIGSRSCAAATAQGDGGFSAVIALGPWEASRAPASVALRPDPASEPAAASTASTVLAKGGAPSAGVDGAAAWMSLTGATPRTGWPTAPTSGALAPRR